MKHIIYQHFDLHEAEEPYADNHAYLRDWIKFLELKIYYYLHYVQKITDTGASKLDKYKGLVVGKEEIIDLLRQMEQEENRDEWENATREQQKNEFRQAFSFLETYLEQRKVISIKQGVFLPFAYLSHIFQLSFFEQHCVILSMLNRIDRKYEKIFGYLQDDVTMKNPTSDLAIKLFALQEKDLEVMELLHILELKLFKYFLRDPQPSQSQQKTLSKPFFLDPKMLEFIFDFPADESKDRFITLFYPGDDLPDLMVQQEIQENLDNIMAIPEKIRLITVHGPEGSGKKLHLRTLAQRIGKPIVFVETKALLHESGEPDPANLHKAVREVLIHDAFLCLTNLEQAPEQIRLTELLEEIWAETGSTLHTIFVTSRQKKPSEGKNNSYSPFELEIDLPNRLERSTVWKQVADPNKLEEEIDLHELANKFHFTPGQIVAGMEAARQDAMWQGEGHITRQILFKACYRQISHQLDQKATLVHGGYTADDLILPPEQKQHLTNACNHVKYRHVVFDKWGFEKKLPYGKGISMLFGGPPGTGKTMAARVIACELGLEMYQIDLSQVVSKYIGETEKNLKEVFEEATKSNVILFFDECDAVLGKRTEVSDSHDRYANLETSFLLQKVEAYEGVSILATNLLSNIDGAFLRRINYVIHFPFPDEKSRGKIWRGIFPDQTPLSADVDFKFLAGQFELAGGSIKNIAVNAAFLAAASSGEVSMRHILLSLKDELSKQGKTVLSGDFGEYGFYLK